MTLKRTALLLSFSLLVASCGQQLTDTPATASEKAVSAFADARPVPLAVGQAMAVKSAVITGQLTQQNVDETSTATALVEDIYGQPFYYLTLTTHGLGTSPEFWSAVNSVTGSRDDTLIATGATTARTLYAFEYDASITRALKATALKAGSVRRLVVPDGGVLWLQDQQGRYWSVLDQRLLGADDMTAAQTTYDWLVQRYVEDKGGMQEAWDGVLNDGSLAPLSTPAAGGSAQSGLTAGLARFVRTDGSLNVQQLIHSLPASAVRVQNAEHAAPITAQYTDDVSGRGFLNRVTSYAGIAGSTLNGYTTMGISAMTTNASWLTMKATDWSNRQSAQLDIGQSLAPGQQWGLRSAFSPATASAPANWSIVGCMGVGYARLLATFAQQYPVLKNRFIANGIFTAQDSVKEQVRKTIAYLAQPVQADGMPSGYVEPYITQKMGGGYFQDGTLITPPGMVNGGVAILNEKIRTLFTAANPDTIGIRFDGWGFMDPTGNGGIAAGSNPAAYWGVTDSGAYTLGNFNAGTTYARDVVRRNMRDFAMPVAFLYSTGGAGGLSGHLAISGAYRSYEYAGGYSDVFLYTAPYDTTLADSPVNSSPVSYWGYSEGFEGPSGWINATNRWSAYGGVYALGPKWQW